MKPKRKAIMLLATFTLIGVMLTGCNDRDNGNSPAETNPSTISPRENVPQQQAPPPDPSHRDTPDSVPPELRHPDGTIG